MLRAPKHKIEAINEVFFLVFLCVHNRTCVQSWPDFSSSSTNMSLKIRAKKYVVESRVLKVNQRHFHRKIFLCLSARLSTKENSLGHKMWCKMSFPQKRTREKLFILAEIKYLFLISVLPFLNSIYLLRKNYLFMQWQSWRIEYAKEMDSLHRGLFHCIL